MNNNLFNRKKWFIRFVSTLLIAIPLQAKSWDFYKNIVGSDIIGNDRFGSAVAVDANTALIGAPKKNDATVCASITTCSTGSAYIFERGLGGVDQWGEAAILLSSDLANGDFFGAAVSIHGDVAVVGAPGVNSNAGAAYIFNRDLQNRYQWRQLKKLVGSDVATGSAFGQSVAVYGDTIIIGAPTHNANVGAAYIFSRNHGGTDNWGEVTKFIPENASNKEALGSSVAIHSNIFVAGAPNASIAGPQTGSVYIYEFNSSSNTWSTTKIFENGLSNRASLGASVSVRSNTALVGVPGQAAGQAFIYKKVNSVWTRVKTLTPTDGQSGDKFGFSVALFNDQIAIGSPNNTGTRTNSGATYTFAENQGGNAAWGLVQKLVSTDTGKNNSFGYALSVADNALVVGAYFEAGVAGFATVFQQYGTVVNGAPIDITISRADINENSTSGSVIGVLGTVDANANDTHQYTLLNSSEVPFAITHNQLLVNGILDHETRASYAVNIRSTDSDGLFVEKIITISINNINEPPTSLSISTLSIPENSPENTVVGDLSATDPDFSDTITFSIVSQSAPLFRIGGTNHTSLVTNGNGIDFETQPIIDVTILAHDNGNSTVVKTFAVQVLDVNEAPIALSLNNNLIAENIASGTVVGHFSVTDVDQGDSHAIAFTASESSPFTIVNHDLVVAGPLDFESIDRYSLTATVMDRGGNLLSAAVTVLVTDVNEAPTNISLAPASVEESAPLGTVIGTFTVTDPDRQEQSQWSLVNDNGGTFRIEGDTLVLAKENVLDFETAPELAISVRVTDSAQHAFEKEITIAVVDVFEAPVIIAPPPELSVFTDIPAAIVNHDYASEITVTNGVAPYHYEWTGHVASLQFEGNKVSGIPTQAGEFTVQLLVNDSAVLPLTKQVDVVIKVKPEQLTVKTEQLLNAIIGTSYSVQLQVNGGVSPYQWSTVSAMPEGLELLKTGLISGRATKTGTYIIGVLVSDANQNVATRSFEIHVYESGLVDVSSALPNARVGREYRVPIIVNGGIQPYNCLIVQGELPPGIYMDSCRLNGSASAKGDYSFVVQVIDNGQPIIGAQFVRAIKVVDPRDTLTTAFNANSNRVTELEHWSKTRPGSAFLDEANTGMATDAFGNHYIVGYAYNGQSYEMHTLKYDAEGIILWHQVYSSGNHDYVYGIAISPEQDVYITGYQLQGNRYQGVILKYDSQGVLQWNRVYPTTSLVTTFYSILSDSSGVYIGGETYNGHDFDAVIAKYDVAGTLQWTRTHATNSNDTTYAMDAIRCQGSTNVCELFVGGATGLGIRTGWIEKLNPNTGGVLTSNTTLSSSDVKSLVVNDGNVYVGGNGVTLGWSLYKLNTELAVLWQTNYSELQARGLRGIAIDENRYLYAAGYSRTDKGDDALVVAFDDTGATIATHIIDKGRNERANSILVDANQNLVISGHSYNSTESVLLMEVIRH